MKRYSINDLSPGMIVGSPIYTSRGQLVLDVGSVLDDHLISRLRFYGILDVMIQDTPGSTDQPDPDPQDTEPTQEAGIGSTVEHLRSHNQIVTQKPEFQRFQVNYSREICSLQDTMSSMLVKNGEELQPEKLLAQVNTLSQDSQTSQDVFDMLHNMRQIDDSIYAHALNVSMISKMLGKWLHFSQEDLDVLTLCGLFHDIGKTVLPLELLTKPGKYTPEEYAKVQEHPVLGYQLIKDQPLDIRIKRSALMHHERCDGSGYPYKLTMDQLDDFAMIVAIADVYDAMTAARSYRDPLCPFQVIAAFEQEGLQKYHPQYILTFLQHIADTYQHSKVMLNSGQTATIVMINKNHLTMPYIQFADDTILDMTTRTDLEIIAVY